MKTRLFGILMAAILAVPAMSGCQAAKTVESAGNAMNQAMDSAMEAASGTPTDSGLTLEEAQSIALKHAGLTANQVTALHTEYEVDHGTPQYDVEFRHESWEYDYEIHADTGEILSHSKDD